MIERSQHGVKKGTAFNTQWISDLTDIFGSDNVSTSGDTTTVSLTDVQGETLEIQSVYSNDVTTVRLYYGASNIEITGNNNDNWLAYRLVKFDKRCRYIARHVCRCRPVCSLRSGLPHYVPRDFYHPEVYSQTDLGDLCLY